MVSGVRFKEIKNLSFFGEDRHFCVRAAALGFSMFMDTHYPAYHIYRESDLKGSEKFIEESGDDTKRSDIKQVQPIKRGRPKLTLSMIVKDEADRYLREVFQEHRNYINEAAIIDDGSTDGTVQVCLNALDGIPAVPQ